MTSNTKKTFVALLASVAMAAAMAPGAEALEWTATGGNYPVAVSGGQTAIFEFKAGPRTVTCSVGSFSGTLTKKETPLKTTPKFEKCKADSGFAAEFAANGCEFLFSAPTKLSAGELRIECGFLTFLVIHIYESETDITDGKEPKCSFLFPPQGPLGTITWSNEGAGNTSRVKGVVVVKPKYSIFGDEKFCGASTGTGEFLGTTTLTGKVGLTAEGIDLG